MKLQNENLKLCVQRRNGRIQRIKAHYEKAISEALEQLEVAEVAQ